MHAVNLRNMLQAKTRTLRQEMNDEDDEFLDLFDGDICYIDGGNQSGFYLVEEQVFETRLYCIEDAAAPRIFPVPLKASSLHPKHVLILGNLTPTRTVYTNLRKISSCVSSLRKISSRDVWNVPHVSVRGLKYKI